MGLYNDGCLNNGHMGPMVKGCRGNFDFTLKFEHIVLSIIPSAVFLLLAIPRLARLVPRRRIIKGQSLQWIKLGCLIGYTAMRVSLHIISNSTRYRGKNAAVTSDTLGFLCGLCMIPLSLVEHSRSLKPSYIMGVYLGLTLLLDSALARTLWLMSDFAIKPGDITYARLFTASVAVKAVVLIVESISKKKYLIREALERSPEETTSLYGLASYYWLNPLFLKGFRKSLGIHDIYGLDYKIGSERLYSQFQPHFEAAKASGKKHSLPIAIARTLVLPLLFPIIPRLLLIGAIFCQPLLIQAVLNHLDREQSQKKRYDGYGLIGAAGIIYISIAVARSLYWYFQERFLAMVRAILASAVYNKTTTLKASASDDPGILTLMNADVERVRGGLMALHDYWADVVEVAVACWLLERQIGISFLAPIIVVFVCIAITTMTGKVTGRRQRRWMTAIEKRVGVTADVIANMKSHKISALTAPVEDMIQKLRLQEIRVGSRWRIMLALAVTVSYLPLTIGPTLVFALSRSPLDVTRVFTSLAYLTLLATPLVNIFQQIPQLITSFTCLKRIQAFLSRESRDDFRLPTRPLRQRQSAEFSQMPPADRSDPAVAISAANFGWVEGRNALSDMTIVIPRASFTMIAGPVASGKSTLLKVLLGESIHYSDNVALGVDFTRIGYCDQKPFLSNDSLRSCVVGYAHYDGARYKEVMEATMLTDDLALLPNGDRTIVGSSGVTLSGGQAQRVALARALYLEAELFVFDDVLSGLDATTGVQVFDRVFGSKGLLRRRGATTILCTHSVRYLPNADHIIALSKDGRILEQGSFKHLAEKGSYIRSLQIQEKEFKQGIDFGLPSETVSYKGDEYFQGSVLKPTVSLSTAREEAEKLPPSLSTTAVYRYYFSTMSTLVLMAFLFWVCAYGFAFNFPTIWLKYWSADVQNGFIQHRNGFYIGAYALVQILCLVSLLMVVLITTQTMMKQAGSALHRQTLRTVISAPLRFFTTTGAGTTTNLFAQDMTLIDSELPIALINLSIALFASIGMLVVVAFASPWLAISYPFVIAIVAAIQLFYLRTSRRLRILDLEAKAPLYIHYMDTLRGLCTLRALGYIPSDIAVNHQLLDTSQRAAYLFAQSQRWLQHGLRLLIGAVAVLVVVLATQLHSTAGFVGAALVTLMTLGDTLATIVQSYTMLETSIGAVARLRSFSTSIQPEHRYGENTEPDVTWPSRGAIDIKGLSACYRPREEIPVADEKHVDDLALRDFTLSIPAGERMAICGRTGSGKSSLILLLLRLLDPLNENGGLTIDSLPVREINRDVIRRRIIAVSQEAVFLPVVEGTTLKTNLDPFDELQDAECLLSILDIVGLRAAVTERGGLDATFQAAGFSQGQRYLLSLARAIVRRRARSIQATNARGSTSDQDESSGGGILLLDEVSSSVDQATEERMRDIIWKEFRGYTIIMVSHRLDMVMECDSVVVMDKGGIAEKGNPKDLVASEKGKFWELYSSGGGSPV